MTGNTAPTLLDVTVALNTENEDSAFPTGAVGTLVSSFIALLSPEGGPDNVTDPDAGAVTGIALTGVHAGHGSWFYSLDGGASWLAVGAVSDGNALLLAADSDTRLYFQPAADFNGSLAEAVTFRAWDRTSGAEGSHADAGVNGGGTAFSTATDTASLAIEAINDAPVVVGGTVAMAAIDEDTANPAGQTVFDFVRSHYSDAADDQHQVGGSAPGSFGGLAIVANGSSAATGQWQYLAPASSTWTDIGAVDPTEALFIDPSAKIRFLPAANFNGPAPELVAHLIDNAIPYSDYFSRHDVTANGGTTEFSAGTVKIGETINSVNDAPVVTSNGFTCAEDDFRNFTLLASDPDDADGSGPPPAFRLSELPAHGTLYAGTAPVGVPMSAGTDYPAASYDSALHAWVLPVFFVPDGDWSGSAEIHYSAVDAGHAASGIATATIQVTPVADPAIIDTHLDTGPQPQGAPLQVTGNVQSDGPAVADIGGGGTLVVWQQGPDSGGIWGQVYDSNGSQGAAFRIADAPSAGVMRPSVAARADGSFAVTWVQDGNDTGGGDVHTAFYAPGGTTPISTLVTVASSDAREADSRIVAAGNGYVVTWAAEHDGHAEIHAQRYDATGHAVGGAFLVASGAVPESTGPNFDYPDHGLAAVGTGGAFVVVTNDDLHIDATLIDSAGNSTHILVDGGFEGTEPVVTGLANGNFVVAWTEGFEDPRLSAGSMIRPAFRSPDRSNWSRRPTAGPPRPPLPRLPTAASP